ncbi:MAG: tetratricopeptide repeat protein, partial [Limisphaerales bacterium]
TLNQSHAYADAETLWRDTIAKNPGAFLARNNLGDLLIQRGQIDAAIAQYKKSVAIHPDQGVFHNLGNALLSRGRISEAWQVFQMELKYDPGSASAWADFGNACLQTGRTGEAIQYLKKAYQKSPNDPMICYNLGNAYVQKKQLEAAIQYWQRAVDLEPYFPMANNNLANAMIFERRIPEAIEHWQRALAAQPDMVSAQVNLAWVLATCPDPSQRDGSDALALAERANHLTGGSNPMVLRVLAAAFAENGQYTDASAAAQRALKLARANSGLASSLQSQLKSYQSHQPYRDHSLAMKN